MATGAAAGILGGAALIAVISVVARIVGFGRQLVFQNTVGATLLGDVYATVNAVPNVVFEIIAGGALASVVVPLLAGPAARGDTEQVKRTTSALLGWTLLVLVPVALLGVVIAGPAAEGLMQGKGEQLGVEVAETFLLLFLPQIPLYGIAVVTAGVLQAHRRFIAAAVAPIISSLVVAGAYLVFDKFFTGNRGDLTTVDRRSELILAGGTTLGVLALALVTLVPVLWRVTGLTPTLRFPPGVGRRARALAAAGVATLLGQQIGYLTSYVLSNTHGSAGAAVTYLNSWMVFLLPYAILAVPIATSTYPRLAQHADTNPDGYRRTLSRSTRAVVAVSALGAGVLVATAWPVARFFAELNATTIDPEPMALALIAFAPGLLGYGLVAHLGRALYARGRAGPATAATLTGWFVVVVLAVLLTGAVDSGLVTAMLGLAHSAGLTVAGILLVGAVVRDAGSAAAHRLIRLTGVGVLAAMVGGAAGFAVADMVSGAVPESLSGALAAGVAAGLTATIVFAVIVGVTDRKDLRAMIGRDAPAGNGTAASVGTAPTQDEHQEGER